MGKLSGDPAAGRKVGTTRSSRHSSCGRVNSRVVRFADLRRNTDMVPASLGSGKARPGDGPASRTRSTVIYGRIQRGSRSGRVLSGLPSVQLLSTADSSCSATFSACLMPVEQPWTTWKSSAARTPSAPTTANAACDNLRVASATAPTRNAASWPAAPARQRFSERKGTPLYRSKLPEDKALSVLQHLQESCGVRQTGRLVGVNKNTVVRLAVVAGQHAQDVHDELVAFSPQDPRSPVR